ncbi:TIGR02206 family membrane protein [Streptococcus suis]|nr:TIGR02206 family membrane protein [Streptococcus suis]NQP18414.1 TIGR02206 family membrane protein [Streptococcus suis]
MFFTSHSSQAPQLDILTYLSLLLIYVGLLYLAVVYHRSPKIRRFFWGLQCLQVIALYSWYMAVDWTLSESLPLYHCRLSMLFMLFAKPGPLKRYFACLGLFGSLVAFVYPVFDPFAFPHVTILSFIIGHYALAVNSLIYLLSEQKEDDLDRTFVIRVTLLTNSLMLLANLFLKGNYGFLSKMPLINSENVAFNFLLETGLFVFAVLLVNSLVKNLLKKTDWNWVRH